MASLFLFTLSLYLPEVAYRCETNYLIHPSSNEISIHSNCFIVMIQQIQSMLAASQHQSHL